MTGRLNSLNSMAESLLELISNKLPVVNHTFSANSDTSLSQYVNQAASFSPKSFQPRNDVAEVVYQYVAPLLGDSIAQQAHDELIDLPVVLTANHHGVDFFAQSVQGTLLFSQREVVPGVKAQTVPVFACGSVAMNNLTYPRGALVYSSGYDDLSRVPVRVPVFPDRVKRQLVSRVGSIDSAMVDRAIKRVRKMAEQNKMAKASAQALIDLLITDFIAPEVMSCDSYSDQAVLLNARIWRKLYRRSESAPELVYLELEKIATMLLEKDLCNPTSLAYSLLFDVTVRQNLLAELEGAKGCWQQAELFGQGDERHPSADVLISGGTFMFWGVDERGRRVALGCFDSPDGAELRGTDDAGNHWHIELTPENLLVQLMRGRLLPSLFTSYMLISLARGVTCMGGYYQAEYLPIMQHGVVNALKNTAGYAVVAEQVSKVPTNAYLSGMQAVMQQGKNSGLIPAGPLEIIAGGGLDSSDLTKAGNLSVRDAHLASMMETLPDVMPENIESLMHLGMLAQDSVTLLGEKVVIK